MLGLIFSFAVQAKGRDREYTEDSLQAMVSREPENSTLWIRLGALAVKSNQVDLAKGYFDEAIKLSENPSKTILEIGGIWLSQGKVKNSLSYLMPNLAHMDAAVLDQLQFELEKEKLYSAQLLALRNLGQRAKAYQPVNRKVAVLAFRMGDLPLSQATLTRFADQLDFEGARNLLLINYFTSGNLDIKILASFIKKFPQAEMSALVHLNYAQEGKWKEVRDYLKREANSPSYRDYYHVISAILAASEDRNEDAVEHYLKAQETTWDRLRVVIDADLYRLYASTGNKFKADQIWETLKEEYQDKDPDLQEFMGRQLLSRSYEKQAKYFYRMVLRRKPGNIPALEALLDDLMGNEDYQTITENIKLMIDRDPFSCNANLLGMEYHNRLANYKELVPYARNATVYCYGALEPYFVLGTALLNLSKPDEARAYFSAFVRKGGDASRVPLSLRE
jgi:hypothetical protein